VRTWKDGQEYVFVPAGSFEMGCVPGDTQCTPEETPRRQVTLAQGFWMGRTEVPIGVYDAYALERSLDRPMVAWGRPEGGERLAAAAVGFEAASAFCAANWARLPSEAEWEYAARAGHDGWKYVWAPDGPPLRDGRPLANVMDLAALRHDGSLPVFTQGFAGYDDGFGIVSPVTAFPPNDFGLYDMGGNVSEWCQERVLRGGSWTTGQRHARISNRAAYGYVSERSGFRCVFDPD
jgi:formylglycine-generating enzyme required for sulfatase activity